MRLVRPSRFLSIAIFVSLSLCISAHLTRAGIAKPPEPAREFRAAWVASVHNINWPSRAGLSASQQKSELVRIFDEARKLRLNAIILQVRPSCDALYRSSIEPWSQYLSGSMGKSPGYDPLTFAVQEAHARGLELHAWFNPFRAIASANTSASSNHVSRTHPSAVRAAGSMKWLDPGLEFSRQHTYSVIRDVVRRYDIDGVHIDDYFYPYPKNAKLGPFPFDDNASYNAYRAQSGKLDRAAWRRQNIDDFVRSLYALIKQEKPWVKFGISPFGIWRPGHPRGIEADLDSFDEIFADSRKWLRAGWCDYFSPQLYWRISDRPHSFSSLCSWWKSESKSGRHVWPGIATDRIDSSADPGRPAQESILQVQASRSGRGSHGHVHWSIKPLLQNRKGVSSLLASQVYSEAALVPASPWLSRSHPAPPSAVITASRSSGQRSLQLSSPTPGIAWWVIRTNAGGNWSTAAIYHASAKSVPLNGKPEAIAATAVDRYGNASAPTILALRQALEN